METFALLLCDRFWKLNRFHRYFLFLSKCKIVDKNVSYETYGRKSIENFPVSNWNSNLKTGLLKKCISILLLRLVLSKPWDFKIPEIVTEKKAENNL